MNLIEQVLATKKPSRAQPKFLQGEMSKSKDNQLNEGVTAQRNLDSIQWNCPPKFSLPDQWKVVAGEQSVELEAQKQREMSVAEKVNTDQKSIPPNPSVSLDSDNKSENDLSTQHVPVIPTEQVKGVTETELATPYSFFPQSNSGTAQQESAIVSRESLSASEVNETVTVAAAVAAFARSFRVNNELLIFLLSNPEMIYQVMDRNRQAASPEPETSPQSVPDNANTGNTENAAAETKALTEPEVVMSKSSEQVEPVTSSGTTNTTGVCPSTRPEVLMVESSEKVEPFLESPKSVTSSGTPNMTGVGPSTKPEVLMSKSSEKVEPVLKSPKPVTSSGTPNTTGVGPSTKPEVLMSKSSYKVEPVLGLKAFPFAGMPYMSGIHPLTPLVSTRSPEQVKMSKSSDKVEPVLKSPKPVTSLGMLNTTGIHPSTPLTAKLSPGQVRMSKSSEKVKPVSGTEPFTSSGTPNKTGIYPSTKPEMLMLKSNDKVESFLGSKPFSSSGAPNMSDIYPSTPQKSKLSPEQALKLIHEYGDSHKLVSNEQPKELISERRVHEHVGLTPSTLGHNPSSRSEVSKLLDSPNLHSLPATLKIADTPSFSTKISPAPRKDHSPVAKQTEKKGNVDDLVSKYLRPGPYSREPLSRQKRENLGYDSPTAQPRERKESTDDLVLKYLRPYHRLQESEYPRKRKSLNRDYPSAREREMEENRSGKRRSSRPRETSHPDSKSQEPCRYFNTRSGCRRGSKCFYKHEDVEAPGAKRMKL